MAVVFSVGLLSAYKYSRAKLGEQALESADIVFTVIATVLTHSIYFSRLSDTSQVVSGFLIALATIFYSKKIFGVQRFKGAIIIIGLVIGYSVLQVFVGSKDLSKDFAIFMGFLYGLTALIAFPTLNKKNGFQRVKPKLYTTAICS